MPRVVVMVVLLRGVNVGGKNRLAMAELRQIATGCGYEGARTYIQSGNLVLVAPEGATTEAVAEDLRAAIDSGTSVAPDVVVRTRDELAAVVSDTPFEDGDPGCRHVVFLAGTADASLAGVDLEPYAPEEAVALGRQLHLFLPWGVGRSPLATDLTRRMGRAGTMRNWRTVTKLLAMAEELA